MLKSLLLIAYRNLFRYKLYSSITTLGLAIGMASSLLMLLLAKHELSFDQMHQKNIYRLYQEQHFEGMFTSQQVAITMFPLGPKLNQDFSQVVNATHFIVNGNLFLRYKEKPLPIHKSLNVDSSFLQMFDFPLLTGNRKTALQQPRSIVLTQSNARKFFGEEEPVGKTVTIMGTDTSHYTVTGVLEDLPATSHLQFDALLSLSTFAHTGMMNDWENDYVQTYVELAPHASAEALMKRFPAFLAKHMDKEAAQRRQLILQPLRQVHGGSGRITQDEHNYQKFDRRYTYLFVLLAGLVLMIAAINFINLATARAAQRAKEVGIRKAVGAFRTQLVGQFLGEALLLSLLAWMVALVLVTLALPIVVKISDRSLTYASVFDPLALLLSLLAAVLLGILSGLYPAMFLSSFQPLQVLKGSLQVSRKIPLRNLLVIGQFAVGIFLVIGTIISLQQMHFLRTLNPGFDKEQVLLIPVDANTNKKLPVIIQQLLAHRSIIDITASNERLGNAFYQTGFKFQGEGPFRELTGRELIVHFNYLSFYNIPLVAGRDFSKAFAADDGKAFIINQTLARELLENTADKSFESLLGKRFGFSDVDSLGRIVGIVKDFNYQSLHHEVEPLAINVQNDIGYGELSLRVKAGQAQAAVRQAEVVWNQLATDQPFQYTFLDEHFEHLYRSDKQVSQVVFLLAGLAILIACLGLFGLALYATQIRIKEIGIRKVLGASTESLVFMLSRDFLKLVAIAFVLAAPVALWVFSNWLTSFAYRINIAWWVFALAGVFALAIAFLTVAFHSIKTARTNPVNSLRNE